MKYIIFFFVLFIPFCAAASDGLAIGQIQASGQTADDEFVEILNAGDAAVEIGAWSIQYKSSSGTKYYKKNFTAGATVPPHGRYVVAGSGYAGAYDMKQSTFSLSSSGGTIYLVNNQTIIDNDADPDIAAQKNYSAETPTNQNGNTNTNIPTNSNANEPVNENVNAPTTKPLALLPMAINEIMPAPADGAEWVEIFNMSDYAVDLAGWHLADGTGKNVAELFGLIFPRAFLKIDLSSDRLNNNGDLVILRNAENREIDSVAYGDWESNWPNPPAPDENVSLARRGDGVDTNIDADDFLPTTTPTPGATNAISAPAPVSTNNSTAKTTPVKTKNSQTLDAKWLADLFKTQSDELAKLLKADNVIIINNLYLGNAPTETKTEKTATVAATTPKPKTTTTAAAKTTVKTASAKTTNSVSGTVIFPPHIVAKDVFVVREADRSVEVRLALNSKMTPAVGDQITATGAWSTAKSLPMPKLLVKTDAAMTLAPGEAPEIKTIKIPEAPDNLNQVVATEGLIVEAAKGKLRLAEGETSLIIKTDFEAQKNERLAAKGLLVRQGNDNLLIPVSVQDLSIIKPPEAPKKNPILAKAAPFVLAAAPPLLLLAAIAVGKKFNRKKKGGDADD